jgi:hypothetical protein
MLVWGITAWRRHHRQMRDTLRGAPDSTRVYVLKSPRRVRYLLANARTTG